MAVITVEQNVGLGPHRTVFYTATETYEPPIQQGRKGTLIESYGLDDRGFWAQKPKNLAAKTVTRIYIPWSLIWWVEEVVNNDDNPF